MEPFRGYNSGRELDRCLSLAMQGAPNSHQRTFGRSKRLRLLSWGVWGLNLIGSFLPNWQGTWQESLKNYSRILGGGFKYLLYFHPYLGKMNPCWLAHIFQLGWFNHQLDLDSIFCLSYANVVRLGSRQVFVAVQALMSDCCTCNLHC